MAAYLATVRETGTALANLRAARTGIGAGAGTGATFVKVNKDTGEITYGQEKVPLPADHRFVISLNGFRHGYIDMQQGKTIDRNMVPMTSGARPVPPGGSQTKIIDQQTKKILGVKTLEAGEYGTFEGGGPRSVTEIEMHSIDELGFNLVFTAWNPSSANRLGSLVQETYLHAEGPDGRAGFVNPVILFRAGKYFEANHTRKDVYHFDYTIIDWLHNDGETLLSTTGSKLAAESAGLDAGDNEDLTEADLAILQ